MRITFLGQAGFHVETRAGSILCDPWFNPAFFASWFPFPSNEGIDKAAIGSPDYLYVSHLHHDHFDPAFLAQHVSKETRVILPDYPIDHLEKALRSLGFRHFLKTENTQPLQVDGLTLMCMALAAPTDGPIGDSALLVDDGETRLLNMNDSRPTDPDRLLQLGPIDALFLQFSGAIWYPLVYEYPQKAIDMLAHKKRVAQLARAYRYIEIINPRFTVPSAGPPCFLDDELFEYNDFDRSETNIFPDQTVFLEYMAERGNDGGRLMLPGTVGDVTPQRFDVRHPVRPDEVGAIFNDKRRYLTAYRERMRPRIEAERATWQRNGIDFVAELRDWFEPLLEQADLICAGVNDSVLLDLGELGVLIDFGSRSVRRWTDERPAYTFRIRPELVEKCIREHYEDWVNELFLSMRFSAARRGAYNDYVYTFFKCLSQERIQYAEGFYAENGPSQGTFEIAGYNVQRRCPHMKADLTRFAVVEDGILTCRLHDWQFELATGRCLTADRHELHARPVGAGDGDTPAPTPTLPTAASHAGKVADAAVPHDAEAKPHDPTTASTADAPS